MTSVSGSGASARVMWAISPASFAAPVLLYLMSVLILQAASSAVSGWPSDHFAPWTVLNVQVLPSAEVDHDFAKSGMNFAFSLSYWIRVG